MDKRANKKYKVFKVLAVSAAAYVYSPEFFGEKCQPIIPVATPPAW